MEGLGDELPDVSDGDDGEGNPQQSVKDAEQTTPKRHRCNMTVALTYTPNGVQ